MLPFVINQTTYSFKDRHLEERVNSLEEKCSHLTYQMDKTTADLEELKGVLKDIKHRHHESKNIISEQEELTDRLLEHQGILEETLLSKDTKLIEDEIKEVNADFDNFRISLLRIIEVQPPEDATTSELMALAGKILEYQSIFQDIEQSLRACHEASVWLYKNINRLLQYARNIVLEETYVKTGDATILRSSLSLEQIERFCGDIYVYIIWISNNMYKGQTPTKLSDKVISMALSNDVYVKVFDKILNNEVTSERGLSSEAVVEIRGYMERFLIEPLSC